MQNKNKSWKAKKETQDINLKKYIKQNLKVHNSETLEQAANNAKGHTWEARSA